MDPDSSKLKSREQQSSTLHTQSPHKQQGKDFATVEDLLRYDAARQEPSKSLETRLATSIEREPPPRLSWWRRIFQSYKD
jgi:hypothetical protein